MCMPRPAGRADLGSGVSRSGVGRSVGAAAGRGAGAAVPDADTRGRCWPA